MRTPLVRSPYDLMQERLRRRPWALLVGCILYNRVRGATAWPVLSSFLRENPNHGALLSWDEAEAIETMELVFMPLGFHRRRASAVWRMSLAYDAAMRDELGDASLGGVDVARLPGCGRYAAESFEIFVRGRLVPKPLDKELRRYVWWARVGSGRRGTD